jgi:hypothetical protein
LFFLVAVLSIQLRIPEKPAFSTVAAVARGAWQAISLTAIFPCAGDALVNSAVFFLKNMNKKVIN